MLENDILDDGYKPLAIFWIFIADAVELSGLGDVGTTADAIISVAVDDILINVLAFKMINGIF